MINDISLEARTEAPQVSLNAAKGPSYSSDHVNDLTDKYHQVMGPASPGPASINTALTTNGTDRLSELMARQRDVQLAEMRNGMVQEIANKSGGQPTPADVQVIQNLSSADLQSPNLSSILEQSYSKAVTNDQLEALNQKTGSYDQAIQSNPGQTSELLDRAEWATSRNMISNNILQDLNKRYSDSNILVKGQAWLQQMVPFRSWYAMNSFLDADKPKVIDGLLPGDTMRQTVTYLHTLPPEQYKSTLQSAVDRLTAQGDYLDAQQMVQATMAFSDDDKNWQNIFAGLDVASVVPGGMIVKALKGSSKAVNLILKDGEAIAKTLGHADAAATESLKTSLSASKLPSHDIQTITDVEKGFASIARPAEMFSGVESKAPAAVLGRLQTAALSRGEKALDLLFNTNKVERNTPQEIQNAVTATQASLNKTFVDQNHHIIDFETKAAEKSPSNVYAVTMVLGKVDGKLFPSKNSAEAFAGRFIKLKTNDFEVTPRGTGWSVDVTRNVDETKGGLRDFTVDTDSKQADNFWTHWLGPLSGADVKLGKEQTRARGVAVMSTEKANHAMTAFSEPFSALAKNKAGKAEFEQFIVRNRDHMDPQRGRGLTYHTLGEFENAWHEQFGKSPTVTQSDAYLSFKQFYDLDWVVRNLDVYKQKAILGVEKISARRSIGKSNYDTLDFEGKVLEGLPRGSKEPFRVAVLDTNGTLIRKKSSKFLTNKEWDAIQTLIDKHGFSPIQGFDSIKIDDDFFDYVVAKDFKRDRVSMNLNYRQGSRVVQKYPYFIKQAKVVGSNGNLRYIGDKAIANARDSVEGQHILETMDRARVLVKNQDAGAKKFFEDNLPMWSYTDFQKAITSGELSVDTPFSMVKAGSRTIDSVNLEDSLRKAGVNVANLETGDSHRLSRLVRGRFLGEQAETDMSTQGVEKGKIFELGTDSQMSPLDALRLSIGDIVDVNVMNDYKIKSVRDYTAQFGHLLDGTKSDFDHNGLQFIYNPKYLPAADPNEVRTAEGVRKAILSLWHQQTLVDRQLGLYKERVVRQVRSALGEGAAQYVNDKALPAIQHADGYMRAFAFHTKMGFFNVKQLFLQTSSAVNIVSISPKAGIKGAMLSTPLIAGAYAPQHVLKGIGVKLAATMGMKAEDYVELVNLFKKSGFNLVANDVSYIDDLTPPRLIQGKFKPILDMGTEFFKTGERVARSMAFATAYMERKSTLLTKAVSRQDEAWILQRAKDLTGNMTRDSNAPYQQGYAAVATQFFGYQMRLMEQMFGSKLTGAEKGRLFAGMSLMYGVPVAMGMTFGVVPVRQWLKDWMTGSGINTDNTPAEPFMDGFASQLLHLMSGSQFNYATTYGPGGITTFYDFWKGNSDFSDLLMGASGGIIGDTIKDADPILKWLGASIDGNDTTSFPLTVEDVIKPLRDVSTVNNAIKLEQAVALGKWISKNENVLTDVSALEGAISAVLGVDPQRVSDAFSRLDAIQARKDNQARARASIIEDYRRGLRALRSGNRDLGTTYFSRAKSTAASADFTEHQLNNIYNMAINEEPMDESVLRQFMEYENN